MALSSNTITAGGAAKFTGGLHRLAGDRLPDELFPAKSIWAWRNMVLNCSVSLCLMRAASNVLV